MKFYIGEPRVDQIVDCGASVLDLDCQSKITEPPSALRGALAVTPPILVGHEAAQAVLSTPFMALVHEENGKLAFLHLSAARNAGRKAVAMGRVVVQAHEACEAPRGRERHRLRRSDRCRSGLKCEDESGEEA